MLVVFIHGSEKLNFQKSAKMFLKSGKSDGIKETKTLEKVCLTPDDDKCMVEWKISQGLDKNMIKQQDRQWQTQKYK